jgi:hypothetical protein
MMLTSNKHIEKPLSILTIISHAMITYQYFESDGLLICRFVGTIELSDIISFVGFTRTTQNAKKNLYDVREADFNVKVDDLPQIVTERDKFPTYPDQIAVFLLGKPKDTVLGTLLVEYTRNQYNVQICSSLELAITILKLSSSKQVLETRLNNLTDKY